MEPTQAYNALLKQIASTLNAHAFRQSGQTFYLGRENNWGLVNFQKSTASDKHEVIFTINIGIASGRLLRFFPPPKFREATSNTKPDIWDCHWRERIGYLLPSRGDLWWKISAETNHTELATRINEVLYKWAIPEMEKYITDEALRDLWLGDKSPGLTPLQRFKYLSVLLKAFGPQELLLPTFDKLRAQDKYAEIDIQRIMTEPIV